MLIQIITAATDTKTYTIDDFEGGFFKIVNIDPGVYKLNVGFEPKNGGERPMAFGDVNNDGFTDVVTVSDNNQIIRVYMFDSETQKFASPLEITDSTNLKDSTIISILLHDLDNDHNMDMIVTINPTATPTRVNIHVWKGSKTGKFAKAEGLNLLNIRKQQPLLFTVYTNPQAEPNANVISSTDGVNTQNYTSYMLIDDITHKRSLYYAQKGDKAFKSISFDKILATDNVKCKGNGDTQGLSIDAQIGSTFIDLNADCRPDLLLVSEKAGERYHEYYIFTDSGFCLTEVAKISKDFTMPSFLDFLNRGTSDMIMIEKSSGVKPKVHVYKNQFKTDLNDDGVCAKSNDVSFPFPSFNEKKSNSDGLVYELDVSEKYSLYSTTDYPSVINLGDIDLDGKTDMILVLTIGAEGEKAKTYPFSFKNEKCSEDALNIVFPDGPTDLQKIDCRYFNNTAFGNELSVFEAQPTVRTGTFDFGEVGSLSFITQQWDEANNRNYIGSYFNFLSRNNYFLKATTKTSGKEFGNSFIGSSLVAVKTEVDGTKLPVMLSQQSGLSHTRMQLPYVIFGLGRINNYIEDFTCGVASTKHSDKSWSPIIPNSQLIITPPLNNADWKIEIYINPTKAMALIIISTLIVLVIIGIVIIIYHVKEKEEDRKANETAYIPFI